MQKATVVKKPKTFWARTRVECIVCGFEGWERCGAVAWVAEGRRCVLSPMRPVLVYCHVASLP